MPRILPLAMLLAVVIGPAEEANAQPFFIEYLSPAGSMPVCDLAATDPANFQGGDPTAQPVLPPKLVLIGQTLSFDLCFIVWPVVDSGGAEVKCLNATGTEVCAVQAQHTFTGMSVDGVIELP